MVQGYSFGKIDYSFYLWFYFLHSLFSIERSSIDIVVDFNKSKANSSGVPSAL